jgi:hypothetical protein
MKQNDIQKILEQSNKVLGKYTDIQNEWFNSPKLKNNGTLAAIKVNNKQGEKNAKSGHMKSIQPLGSSKGGKIGGVILRDSGKLLEHSKLGNEANQQKHGKRIIGTNLITGESWEYISNHEAERDTKVPTCTIRKILRGEQPKTKSGWTFEEII